MLIWKFALVLIMSWSCFHVTTQGAIFPFFSFLKAASCFSVLTGHHLPNPLLMDIWISIFKKHFQARHSFTYVLAYCVSTSVGYTPRSQKIQSNLIEGNKLLSQKVTPIYTCPSSQWECLLSMPLPIPGTIDHFYLC